MDNRSDYSILTFVRQLTTGDKAESGMPALLPSNFEGHARHTSDEYKHNTRSDIKLKQRTVAQRVLLKIKCPLV